MKKSAIFFTIAILAFSLTFMGVEGADREIAYVSGIKLAFGGEVNLVEKDLEIATKANEQAKLKVNWWALIALMAAVTGLITALILEELFYWMPFYAAVITPFSTAAAGVVSMFLTKSAFVSQMGQLAEGITDTIHVSYSWGWWVALIGFTIAGILAIIHAGRKTLRHKEELDFSERVSEELLWRDLD